MRELAERCIRGLGGGNTEYVDLSKVARNRIAKRVGWFEKYGGV